MAISDIPRGTTRSISVEITISGSNPDISGDKVTLTIKSDKGDADPGVLQEDADVTTSGASGVALFDLSTTDTDIEPGRYEYDIVWYLAGGDEHVIDSGLVTFVERVSDL
jgi:hypothetical protein